MDKALKRATEIEERVLRESAAVYEAAASAVIRRHTATLRALRELEKDGLYEIAQVRMRSSGLIDELATALARAGADAAQLIESALAEIREVMANEDDGETA